MTSPGGNATPARVRCAGLVGIGDRAVELAPRVETMAARARLQLVARRQPSVTGINRGRREEWRIVQDDTTPRGEVDELADGGE